MTTESWLNEYYRTIISSFSINNTHDQNVLLLSEINDLNPELLQEAYDLIIKGNITKYQCLSNNSYQCFYVTEGDKTHFTIHGFCTCTPSNNLIKYSQVIQERLIYLIIGFKYRDSILVKEKEFTCVHEIVFITMEYIIPNINQDNSRLICKRVYLNESEFLDKIKSLSVF